jgi:hypothetical protein
VKSEVATRERGILGALTRSWSSQSLAHLISESMTLRSSASEAGLVAGTDENGIARGCGRATAAARGRRSAAPRDEPEEGRGGGSGAAGGGVEGHGERGGGGGECRFTRVYGV